MVSIVQTADHIKYIECTKASIGMNHDSDSSKLFFIFPINLDISITICDEYPAHTV